VVASTFWKYGLNIYFLNFDSKGGSRFTIKPYFGLKNNESEYEKERSITTMEKVQMSMYFMFPNGHFRTINFVKFEQEMWEVFKKIFIKNTKNIIQFSNERINKRKWDFFSCRIIIMGTLNSKPKLTFASSSESSKSAVSFSKFNHTHRIFITLFNWSVS
jgi:hypothetical protein